MVGLALIISVPCNQHFIVVITRPADIGYAEITVTRRIIAQAYDYPLNTDVS